MQWPSGARYEGMWEHNMAHGQGKFIHSNGDVYEGEMRYNRYCG